MSTQPTASHLLDQIRASGLLKSAQLDELAQGPEARSADAGALTRLVRQRGWLTPFQLNSIAAGGGKNLIVGPYVLLARLGEGAMGHVYKARHRHTHRVVALKLIRKEKLSSPDIVRALYAEAENSSALQNPHIVQSQDAGPVGKSHYLAMEYVEGIDLARLVRERGPLSVSRACEYIRQAALGLHHLHENERCHGDVRPSKLLVTRTDTGDVVKLLGIGHQRPTAADYQADLQGLGRSLAFLLKGFPLRDESQGQTIPPQVQDVLDKLNSPESPDSYGTAGDVAEDLAYITQKKRSARRATRRSPMLLVGVGVGGLGVLVLGLVAVLVLYFTGLETEQPGPFQHVSHDSAEFRHDEPAKNVVTKPANETPSNPLDEERIKAASIPEPVNPIPEKEPVKPPPVVEPVKPPVGERIGAGRIVLSKPGVNAAAYCLGGSHFVVTSNQDAVRVINANTGEERHRFGTPTLDGESRGFLAVSGDGGVAIVAHADRVPRLWDLEKGKLLHELVDHKEQVRAVTLSEDGRFALSAGGAYGKDQEVRVWDARTGKLLRKMGGHEKDVWQVAISPDGKRAAAVSWDHVARIWDMETGKELRRYENLKPLIVRSVRFSPDSKSLVFACLYGLAVQCEAETGKEERRFVGARSWVWEAAFTPDSRLVVTTSGYDNKRGDGWVVDDGTVRVHDAATGALRATLSGHKRVPGQLTMSPDSRHALVADQGGTVIEWDLPSPRP